jgi:hypothetical protein
MFGPPSKSDIGSFFAPPAAAIVANTSRPNVELPFLRDDLIEDGWKEHEVDELWVELCSATRFDDLRCCFGPASIAIPPAMGYRVEGIGKGYDSR